MDEEPVVTLTSGATVMLAVYESLSSVQAAGFTVSIDDTGDVWISPVGLHPDVAFVLTSNSDAVALILSEQAGRVH